jgi:topoisomerase-4 subunit B
MAKTTKAAPEAKAKTIKKAEAKVPMKSQVTAKTEKTLIDNKNNKNVVKTTKITQKDDKNVVKTTKMLSKQQNASAVQKGSAAPKSAEKPKSSEGTPANYDESKIKTLSSLEHIRLRSGMYIGRLGDGSNQDDGIYVLIK